MGNETEPAITASAASGPTIKNGRAFRRTVVLYCTVLYCTLPPPSLITLVRRNFLHVASGARSLAAAANAARCRVCRRSGERAAAHPLATRDSGWIAFSGLCSKGVWAEWAVGNQTRPR